MYLTYCLLLFTFVYFLPGLAFFPQLICAARTAFAIPILSVLIIYSVSSLLIALNVLNANSVTLAVFLFGGIALIRMKKIFQEKQFFWSHQEKILYILHLIVFIPYLVKTGTHAFDRGDELYSWNFWAIQQYFHIPIDFSHTEAIYPQLFPKLLAFCYHLLGSIELQLPVKGTLIIFPLTMLIAISMSVRRDKKTHFGMYILLLCYVLAGIRLTQFFNDGYADPIMTSALIVSVVLFWQSQQKTFLILSPKILCGLSVLCAIVCAHAKQAGLLWTLFSLPLLLLYVYRKSLDKTFLLLSMGCFIGGIVWLLGDGGTFYHNEGVISLSRGQRGIFSQLLYASNKYFIQKPQLLLLFLLAIYAGYQEKILRLMMLTFMLPSLLLWLIFGAYQLRLGQHLIALAFFIIIASGYKLPQMHIFQRYISWWWLKRNTLLISGAALSTAITIFYFGSALWLDKGALHLYGGGKQSLYRYFEDETEYVYKMMYSKPEVLLWVPSRYLYGLFYHHTNLITPNYLPTIKYTKAILIEELTLKKPDYVFTVDKHITDGPASEILSELIQECPRAFEKVTRAKNKFGLSTYKIDKAVLLKDRCLFQLKDPQDIAFKG